MIETCNSTNTFARYICTYSTAMKLPLYLNLRQGVLLHAASACRSQLAIHAVNYFYGRAVLHNFVLGALITFHLAN